MAAAELARVAGRGRPARIELACARRWAASERFTPVSLGREMDALYDQLDVKRSTSRSFMLVEGRDSGAATRAHEFEVVRMRPAELWSGIAAQSCASPAHYHYLTAPARGLCPDASQALWPEVATLGVEDAQALDPSLWIGGAGSTTLAHYDVLDNVLVQLHGTKRVTLWPPSAAAALCVYPDTHARARKSQLHLELDGPARASPADVPRAAYDEVLRPGDALYIPPFYFHHVAVLADAADGGAAPGSVSVNVFSAGRGCSAAAALLTAFGSHWQPLPLAPHWPRDELLAPAIAHALCLAHAAMADALGAECNQTGAPRVRPLSALLAEVAESRYGALVRSLRERAAHSQAGADSAACAQDLELERRRRRRKRAPAGPAASAEPPPSLEQARTDVAHWLGCGAGGAEPAQIDVRALFSALAQGVLAPPEGRDSPAAAHLAAAPRGGADADCPAPTACAEQLRYGVSVCELVLCHLAELLCWRILGHEPCGAGLRSVRRAAASTQQHCSDDAAAAPAALRLDRVAD